jgi:hypothetical protein
MIFIDSSLNGVKSRDSLNSNRGFTTMKEAFGDKPLPSQKDSRSCHTAKISVQAIKEQIPVIEDWPPNSPDTSAIENCRAIVTDEIGKRSSEDRPSLKRVLTEE